MPREFLLLCVVLLISVGAVIILTAWIVFKAITLNPEKAIKTNGELIGFRAYSATIQYGKDYIDYDDNRPGRKPIISLKIDGEATEISAAWSDYSLTKSDIGKILPVLYQKKLGVIMIIDGEKPIHDYLQRNNILFWCLTSTGIILIIIGLVFAKGL